VAKRKGERLWTSDPWFESRQDCQTILPKGAAMENEIVKEIPIYYELFIQLIIGAPLAIIYCKWFINKCKKHNQPAPYVAFSFVGWGNVIFGILLTSGFNLWFGLIILFYKYVTLPYRFDDEKVEWRN
jgi:hypothetical protein